MRNEALLKELESLIDESQTMTEPTKEQMREKVKGALTPLETDEWIYRIVVSGLALAILLCLAFTFVIVLKDTNSTTNIPEIFMAVGSAAVGALAGLLAPSPGRGGD